MGNIRQTNIKRVAKELVKMYPDQFIASDFQHNKEKVVELAEIQSKILRNRVAGYISRLLAPNRRKHYNET